tara:strand:- start:7916 stop:9361 length:1446 start_codon:yes stop_codon:yes gene_type:complete
MAGEGLFFTGVVLKNNRDLIQEENARKRLSLLEEQINIQKQNAADRRARERQEGIRRSSAEADFTGISSPRIKSEIIDRASDFNNFVANNYDSQDPLVQSEIQSRRDDLRLFTEYAKGLDTKITKYDPLNPDAASLRYQIDDEGNNMIEVNTSNIFQELEDGTFNLKGRIASFEDDFDGQVIQDETTPGYMADIEALTSKSFIGADGNTYEGLPPKSEEDFLNEFEKNHLINPNTRTFASTQAEKDYMTNERFSIGDAVLDGIGAYMAEVEGIKNKPKPEMRERFNPNNSELFDEKLHIDYVKYLGKKIWERETANRNTLLTRKATEKEDPLKVSDKFINIFNSPAEGENIGGVNVKVGDNFRVVGPASTGAERGKFIPVSFNQVMGVDARAKIQDVVTDLKQNPNASFDGRIVGVGQEVGTNKGIAILQAGAEDDSFRFTVPIKVAEQVIIDNYDPGSFARELLKYDANLQIPKTGELDE